MLLSLGVSAGKQLSGTLYGETEPVQQPWNVLLVVGHAKVHFDPVLDHWTVPHPSSEARCLRAAPNDLPEMRQLLVAQAVRSAGGAASPKPLNTLGVIPTNPLLDGGR